MKIVGHRGARGLAPENTIASLRKALEHGVDIVEFDVRVTRDSVPVLLHGTHLTDRAGNSLSVSEHTYAELKQHDLNLATLEEALAYIDAKIVPYVEVKEAEPVQPIVGVLKKFIGNQYAADGIWLGSKSQKTLMELHEALPEVPTIVIERWSGVKATHRARQLKTKYLAMNQRWLWWGFIHAMKRGGYQLYPYTMNDPAKVKRWKRYGLAGVITDYPDQFHE